MPNTPRQYTPRMGAKSLADLCHRLAISAESGVDIRRTWEREANNARGRSTAALRAVHAGVSAGDSLGVSLARTGRLFPRLFLEMVHVGEQTGSLAPVLHRLSDHYRRQHKMVREFRVRLVWPAIQLVAAVVIIGVMLAVLAMLDAKSINGEPIDVLGLGVTGTAALARYIQIVVAALLAAFALLYAVRNGLLAAAPLQRLVMKVPVVGPAIEKICLARLAWALHLTLNVEMDLRRLVPLVLRSTGSDYYISHSKQITADVTGGDTLYEAFAGAGVFPPEFLDALYVAEESGQIVESMGRLSQQYEEEAERAMSTLSTVFSFMIWAGIAGMITVMIFRLVKVLYLDMLDDVLHM